MTAQTLEPATGSDDNVRIMAKKRKPNKVSRPKPPALFSPEWLKSLRARLHLSTSQAAHRIGVSIALWSRWEKGDRSPDASRQRLLWVLDGKPLDDFPE